MEVHQLSCFLKFGLDSSSTMLEEIAPGSPGFSHQILYGFKESLYSKQPSSIDPAQLFPTTLRKLQQKRISITFQLRMLQVDEG